MASSTVAFVDYFNASVIVLRKDLWENHQDLSGILGFRLTKHYPMFCPGSIFCKTAIHFAVQDSWQQPDEFPQAMF
jgi:hypothetical protein